MEILKFVRKPFEVDGVRVTDENLYDVAKWCNGEVREGTLKPGGRPQKYVHVRVLLPIKERHTKAFAGDYILYAGTGYKVYTAKAFADNFEEKVEDDYNYAEKLTRGSDELIG